MNKYLIEIKIIDDYMEVRTEEIKRITKELEPYLVDLKTLTNFLFILDRSKTKNLPSHWKTGNFVKIERFELL